MIFFYTVVTDKIGAKNTTKEWLPKNTKISKKSVHNRSSV